MALSIEQKKKRSRKYYLHKRVKAFCSLKVYSRTMYLGHGEIVEMLPKRIAYINELRDTYGYAIQLEIK